MIYYQIKLEDDKIKILDVVDKDYKPKDSKGVMFVTLEEMNKFNQSIVESEYSSGIEKYL